MLCVAGTRNELPPRLVEDMGRYRHKVFVSHLGWVLPTSGDIELDEFDGPDAVYVSSRDEHGLINGVARLLPTTAPYLLENVFPSLWGEARLPHSHDIWELSRFAAVDFNASTTLAHQASAKQAAGLFRHVVQVARDRGARLLVTVSPIGMERLLRTNGFPARRAGPPMKCGADYIVSLSIDLAHIEASPSQ